MTDYSQATDFGDKDVLVSGNPSKAVKGVELDVELAAISVAILSKYDSADVATQAEAEAGTINTKLMTPLRTTQWFSALIDAVALYKSAAETVNNSSTLQDDDHIAGFTIEASQSYRVRGVLHFSIKAASDLKICLTLASAPTAINIAFAGVGATSAAVTRAVQTASGTGVALVTGSNEEMVVLVDGIIRNDADATTMKLQWAQNSAQSEDLVANIGSFLEITKL